jgi:YidC/Oxa1 family membrane protein insertase
LITLKPDQIVKAVNEIAYSPALQLTKPWDMTFFGLPLGSTPRDLLGSYGFLILLVPILTGLFQFFQSKMMFAPSVQLAPNEKKPTEPDFATAFQTQSLFLFPAMLGFLSFTFPLGLSFYWNTFTIFGMIQQYKLQGWGGL